MTARRDFNPSSSSRFAPHDDATSGRDMPTDQTAGALAEPEGQTVADLSDSWRNACRRLRAELGEAVFTSWFARLELDGVADGTAFLSVPTTFLRAWIQSHYSDKLLAVLSVEAPSVQRVTIALRKSGRVSRPTATPTVDPARPEAARRPVPAAPVTEWRRQENAMSEVATPRPSLREPATAVDDIVGSPLDRRYTFTNFLTGRSNQLAFAAAEQVGAAGPGTPPVYSPLYIHAAVGLGKTHLLQAVAHGAQASGRRVIYLTAERFMYGFIASLKAQTAIAFKERLRAIDVLVIDDVQFLQGRSVQQEFCHTLNALIDDGRQVVVAADRPPAELEQLEDRIRSRLAGGLCVGMEPLDEGLRIKFLETRVASLRAVQAGFELSAAVINYVARVVTTNGRDLDGALNRLMAHATLNAAPHTIASAEAAISDLVKTREPKRVKIEDIQKLVANHYNVSRADILSSRRTAAVVLPRQIAMYLSKSLTLRSLPEIGRRFGGRDHTTVLHAVRKIEALSGTETTIAEDLELLKRMLQD